MLISILLVLAAVSAGPVEATECKSLDSLRWLLGDWTADGSKTTFSESWVEVGPRTFEGTGIERAKAAGTVNGTEELRLVQMADGVFYVSKVPDNELPIAFRLNVCSDGRFAFDNAAHDFPRRLEYRLEPEGRLTVRVSDGADQGFTVNYARSDTAANATTAVLAAEDQRFAAMLAGDAAAMRLFLAMDLEYVHSSGQVESRDQLIDSIVSSRLRYVTITPIERSVVMLGGNSAAVRGRGRFQVIAGATPLDLQIRYLAVYGMQDGIWQLRSWQSLRTP